MMGAKHMLTYHVAIPVGIVVILVLVGTPLATALVVGMMTGCMSMMIMMGRAAAGGAYRNRRHERDTTEHARN